eukprot:1161892-Pelagomonas_calceolata.AAC.1
MATTCLYTQQLTCKANWVRAKEEPEEHMEAKCSMQSSVSKCVAQTHIQETRELEFPQGSLGVLRSLCATPQAC